MRVPSAKCGDRRAGCVGENIILSISHLAHRISERGQALAETAIFSIMAVLLAFGLLTFIPQHRARTMASSAAYSCAQFVSQSPNPVWAIYQAEQVAWDTLKASWSSTLGVKYDVEVIPPTGPGGSTGCVVFYRTPILFNGLLGLKDPGWSTKIFISQSETWKGRWR